MKAHFQFVLSACRWASRCDAYLQIAQGMGGIFLSLWDFLVYLQLSIPGKGRWMSEWMSTSTPGLTRCVWKIFVCAQTSLWLLERHIKLNWGTQEPPHFKEPWQSRHQILAFWYRWCACIQRESQAQYPVPWKPCVGAVGLSAVLWQCFGWKLSLKNIGATSAKHLRLMAVLCHRDQSPYPLGTNQNTLLSQLSRCGAQCWEVNWHLFWFVWVPLYSS